MSTPVLRRSEQGHWTRMVGVAGTCVAAIVAPAVRWMVHPARTILGRDPMNDISTRRSLLRSGAAMIAGGVLAGGVVAGTSAAAEAPNAHITAHPTKSSVDSGEQFRVHGLFTINGSAAVNRTVKIQSKTADGWTNLTGAHVSTGSDGRYGLRVVLSMKGKRTLRAVGITPSSSVPNPRAPFTVTVS